MDKDEEMLPVVDATGNITGAASRKECHDGSMLLHPVVHLHVFNTRGDLYLQKRPDWKTIQPGKWDTAVGGHVDLGESVEEALRRETREEIGLEDFQAERIAVYEFQSDVERELVFVYKTLHDGPLAPSAELAGGRFWTPQELREALGTGLLTPNFELEIPRILPHLPSIPPH